MADSLLPDSVQAIHVGRQPAEILTAVLMRPSPVRERAQRTRLVAAASGWLGKYATVSVTKSGHEASSTVRSIDRHSVKRSSASSVPQ